VAAVEHRAWRLLLVLLLPMLLCPFALLQDADGTLSSRKPLTSEQKQRRVVMKRVNLDRAGVRYAAAAQLFCCLCY
jgi:hypothetical protein